MGLGDVRARTVLIEEALLTVEKGAFRLTPETHKRGFNHKSVSQRNIREGRHRSVLMRVSIECSLKSEIAVFHVRDT